jgi:hypothetical protein
MALAYEEIFYETMWRLWSQGASPPAASRTTHRDDVSTMTGQGPNHAHTQPL